MHGIENLRRFSTIEFMLVNNV